MKTDAPPGLPDTRIDDCLRKGRLADPFVGIDRHSRIDPLAFERKGNAVNANIAAKAKRNARRHESAGSHPTANPIDGTTTQTASITISGAICPNSRVQPQNTGDGR
jgi:hypothetical protein